ncbi:MAG: STAS domain-containing protein [Ruminococcaceae bacterium]|nr:STAS domain-containing protein [Oscillospiraceae bacterium]
MAVEFSKVDDLLVVAPTGEIDHHETKEIREEIDEMILSTLPKKIAFDLSRTTFMDSSGLGLILGRFNKVSALGIQMELVNPGEKIMRIITMAGVDKIIKVKGVEK